MRRIAIMICTLSIASAQQIQPWYDATPLAWGPLREGWRLAIFAQKQSFFTDEPVMIVLVEQNTTSARRRVAFQKSPWDVAEFTIKGVADGKPITLRSPRDRLEKLQRKSYGGGEAYAAPGQSLRPGARVDLRRLFDLGPGTYTIQAIQQLPNVANKAYMGIPSNEITISIVAR